MMETNKTKWSEGGRRNEAFFFSFLIFERIILVTVNPDFFLFKKKNPIVLIFFGGWGWSNVCTIRYGCGTGHGKKLYSGVGAAMGVVDTICQCTADGVVIEF